jgi:hypothetical protein
MNIELNPRHLRAIVLVIGQVVLLSSCGSRDTDLLKPDPKPANRNCYISPRPSPSPTGRWLSYPAKQDPKFELQSVGLMDFSRDIYPILSSQSNGRKYKCTVCHAATYSSEANMRDLRNVDQVIDSVSAVRMPQPGAGDRMNQSDMNTLRNWRSFVAQQQNSIPQVSSSYSPNTWASGVPLPSPSSSVMSGGRGSQNAGDINAPCW